MTQTWLPSHMMDYVVQITCWLEGRYSRAKTARTNEYQLDQQATVNLQYQNQQQLAYGSLLRLLRDSVGQLESAAKHNMQASNHTQSQDQTLNTASANEAVSIPAASRSHESQTPDQEAELIALATLSPDADLDSSSLAAGRAFLEDLSRFTPMHLPYKQTLASQDKHLLRCAVNFGKEHEAACLTRDLRPFLANLFTDWLSKHISNFSDVNHNYWLTGDPDCKWFDVSLSKECFASMIELLFVGHGLCAALNQVIAVSNLGQQASLVILLNDNLAIIKDSGQDAVLQKQSTTRTPLLIAAVHFHDHVYLQCENTHDATIYSVHLDIDHCQQHFKLIPAGVPHVMDSVKLTLPGNLQTVTGAGLIVEASNGLFRSNRVHVKPGQQGMTICSANNVMHQRKCCDMCCSLFHE